MTAEYTYTPVEGDPLGDDEAHLAICHALRDRVEFEPPDGEPYARKDASWELVQAAKEFVLQVWAEENAALGTGAYEWAFGNGAATPNNAGITIYVPPGWSCEIIAMTGTTNNASGSSVIEAEINGTLQGANCNVTLSGRSGVNNAFAPVPLVTGDRLNFRTTTAGINSQPSTVCAWLRYYR